MKAPLWSPFPRRVSRLLILLLTIACLSKYICNERILSINNTNNRITNYTINIKLIFLFFSNSLYKFAEKVFPFFYLGNKKYKFGKRVETWTRCASATLSKREEANCGGENMLACVMYSISKSAVYLHSFRKS